MPSFVITGKAKTVFRLVELMAEAEKAKKPGKGDKKKAS